MKFLIVFSVYLISVPLYSQETKNNELKNLKTTAISVLLNEYFTYHKESNEENFKDDILYIIDENLKDADIEDIKSSLIIKSIDIQDRKNKKILRRGIETWKINLVLNEDIIIVTVGYFGLKYKNHKYLFRNEGGSNVYFKISCKEKKWNLFKIEHNGI